MSAATHKQENCWPHKPGANLSQQHTCFLLTLHISYWKFYQTIRSEAEKKIGCHSPISSGLLRLVALWSFMFFLPWCKKNEKNQEPNMLPRTCHRATPHLAQASTLTIHNFFLFQNSTTKSCSCFTYIRKSIV